MSETERASRPDNENLTIFQGCDSKAGPIMWRSCWTCGRTPLSLIIRQIDMTCWLLLELRFEVVGDGAILGNRNRTHEETTRTSGACMNVCMHRCT